MTSTEAPATPDVLDTSAAGPAAVRGGAIRVISYGAGSLLSAGGAALLFRQLGLINTGRYVTATSVVAIVGGISDLGLNAIGVREGATLDAAGRSQLFADLMGLRMTLTLLGLAITLPIVGVGYPTVMVFGVLLAGIGLLAQTMQDNLSLLLLVQLRLGAIAAVELLRQVLMVLGIVVLVALNGHLLAFLSLAIPVGVVMLVVAGRLVRGHRTLRPNFDRRRWRALVMRVLPYSAAAAASVLYFRVAVVMVSQLSSARQQGLFGASYRIIDFLTLVPGVLTGAALPIFSRAASADHDRFAYGLGKVFEVGMIIGAGATLTIGAGAPLILRLLGGAQYAPAAGVLTIQAVGLGATFVGIVWANGLLSLALYRHIMALNVAGLVGIVVLLALLVPDHGARGAAVATALGEIGAAVGSGTVLVRRHPALKRSLKVIPRVALAAGLGVATLAIPGLSVLERTALAGVVYLAGLLVLRAFPPELRDLFPQGGLRARRPLQ